MSLGLWAGGVAAWFARGFKKGGPTQGAAKRGIYAGREIAFGNNVSFSKRRTRRNWKVNAHWRRYWSDILNDELKIKVSAHATRCIKKAGGLDRFLLDKPHLVRDSEFGQNLRSKLIQTKEAKERAAILHHLGIKV